VVAGESTSAPEPLMHKTRAFGPRRRRLRSGSVALARSVPSVGATRCHPDGESGPSGEAGPALRPLRPSLTVRPQACELR